MTRALDRISQWPVDTVAAAVVRLGDDLPGGLDVLDSEGPTGHVFRLASIGKTMATWATLVAVEEGTVSLDDALDDGVDDGHVRTVRHALAHAAGYGFDAGSPTAAPERRRTYGNLAFELVADHVAAASGMPFADYLSVGVFEPLAMTSSSLDGSPATQVHSTVDDVARFLAETVTPVLVTAETAAEARRVQWPDLGGIVPGVGRFETCPWGLGFEIRGDKSPHWTSRANSHATYGHFGGAGTMTWVDPAIDPAIGVVALTDRSFDEWADDALTLWPELGDAVLEEFAGAH